MSKFILILEKALYYLLGISFIGLFLINVVQIILRSFMGISLLWVVELSQLIIIWIVGFGAALALHQNEHLLIGFIKEKFPKKIELSIDLCTRLMLLVFYIVLIVTGLEITQIRMSISYVSLGWPTGIAYLSIPVSGVLMCFFALVSISKIISALRESNKEI